MTIIRLKVTPSAKRDSVEEISPGVLKVATREPAEDNRANRAVLEAVARFYGIPRNKLRLISGHQKPSKLVEILGEFEDLHPTTTGV